MSRLLFAHDHRFARDGHGQVYSTTGAFPTSLWERYLAHFHEVHVLARLSVGASSRVVKTARDGVTFTLVESASPIDRLPGSLLRRRVWHEVAAADAVVARLPSELGIAAADAARHLGKPLAVEVVGCAWDAYWHHGSALAKAYAPIAFFRMRSITRGSPNVLYVTERWLQERYPSDGFLVSASNVELAPPTDGVIQARCRRIAEIAVGRRPQLGTIASLKVAYKGLSTALKSLATLRKHGTDLEYRILGAGDTLKWRKQAKALKVDDLVHFDGTLPPGRAVEAWLDNIDFYLQPSLQEGLPRSLLEAMNRGCICIGSNAGGIPELLPQNLRHRRADDKELTRRIEDILKMSRGQLEDASTTALATSANYHASVLRARRACLYRRLVAAAPPLAKNAKLN